MSCSSHIWNGSESGSLLRMDGIQAKDTVQDLHCALLLLPGQCEKTVALRTRGWTANSRSIWRTESLGGQELGPHFKTTEYLWVQAVANSVNSAHIVYRFAVCTLLLMSLESSMRQNCRCSSLEWHPWTWKVADDTNIRRWLQFRDGNLSSQGGAEVCKEEPWC